MSKNNEENVTKIMDQLSHAYSDPEVKKIPELRNAIFKAAKELEKDGNIDLVATRLCHDIKLTWFAHKDNFPKAASKLYTDLSVNSLKYKNTAIGISVVGSMIFH